MFADSLNVHYLKPTENETNFKLNSGEQNAYFIILLPLSHLTSITIRMSCFFSLNFVFFLSVKLSRLSLPNVLVHRNNFNFWISDFLVILSQFSFLVPLGLLLLFTIHICVQCVLLLFWSNSRLVAHLWLRLFSCVSFRREVPGWFLIRVVLHCITVSRNFLEFFFPNGIEEIEI